MKAVELSQKKKIRTRSLIMSLTVIATLGLAGCAGSDAPEIANFDPGAEIATPSQQLKFKPVNPKISMADSYGDRFKGGHGTFGTFPANFQTPYHTHSQAYHGIVIKGVMTNPFRNKTTNPEMGPGSYWYVPANSVHATACVSNVACEFYFHADGPFDFKVVK